MRTTLRILCLLTLSWCACNKTSPVVEEIKETSVPEALPMKEIALEDLSAFQASTSNWAITGAVISDYSKEQDIQVSTGKGVLVNQPAEAAKGNLVSNFEHGDIELEFEFLMPKGSNSGIYFQSRYELQLLDSWGKENPGSGDCGGIYERWDDSQPAGEQGYDGHAPMVNASRAPGLWQHFSVFFRAPRFDTEGKKIKNAAFESVYFNGILIHENIELTGPTRGAITDGGEEVAYAPFLIQGDHGPSAFRNIKYKAYTQDSIRLTALSYALYEGKWDTIPNFSELIPTKKGTANDLDVTEVSGMTDHFGLVFKGKMEVPLAGEYLFQTLIDDGGVLTIDSQIVVYNQGDPGLGLEGGLVNLSEGIHDFELSFYEEVWFAHITLYYEGPGIYKHTLASEDITIEWNKNVQPLYLDPVDMPEMVRGFVNYDGEKRTHTISVGSPKGMHFSYDLAEGTLLKAWKGNFADVTNMWVNRGESQLLLPRNATIETIAGIPVAVLGGSNDAWPAYISDDFQTNGYRIDSLQRPIFKSRLKNTLIEDQITPGADGWLHRTMTLPNGTALDDMYFRLAAADNIDKMPDGSYRIGGTHYLKLIGDDEALSLRTLGDQQELIVAVPKSSAVFQLSYALLW